MHYQRRKIPALSSQENSYAVIALSIKKTFFYLSLHIIDCPYTKNQVKLTLFNPPPHIQALQNQQFSGQ